jgi:hypothetical protein
VEHCRQPIFPLSLPVRKNIWATSVFKKLPKYTQAITQKTKKIAQSGHPAYILRPGKS